MGNRVLSFMRSVSLVGSACVLVNAVTACQVATQDNRTGAAAPAASQAMLTDDAYSDSWTDIYDPAALDPYTDTGDGFENPCPEGWLESTEPVELSDACLNTLMVTVELFPEFKALDEDPMDFFEENIIEGPLLAPEYPTASDPVPVEVSDGDGDALMDDGMGDMDAMALTRVEIDDISLDTENQSLEINADQLDLDIGIDNPDADGDAKICDDGTLTAHGHVTFDVPFKGHYGPAFIKDFGAVRWRHHWVYGEADFKGIAHLKLGGSITGNQDKFEASLTGSGHGRVTARVHVWQKFKKRRRYSTHTVATATIIGDFSFADSATVRKGCDDDKAKVITGRPHLSMAVQVPSFRFHGLLFPNLNGPIVRGVRNAVTRFVHRRIRGQVQNFVDGAFFQATNKYQAKKAELIQKLTGQLPELPEDCGCGDGAGVEMTEVDQPTHVNGVP